MKRSKCYSTLGTTNGTVNQPTSQQQTSPERSQPSDERSHAVPSRSVTRQPRTPSPPTSSNAQVTQCIGQPITVVSIGAASARAAYSKRGCQFQQRCSHASPECHQFTPPLTDARLWQAKRVITLPFYA